MVMVDGIALYGSRARPLPRCSFAPTARPKRREILGRRLNALSADCRAAVERCETEAVRFYVPVALVALHAIDARRGPRGGGSSTHRPSESGPYQRSKRGQAGPGSSHILKYCRRRGKNPRAQICSFGRHCKECLGASCRCRRPRGGELRSVYARLVGVSRRRRWLRTMLLCCGLARAA